MPVTYKSDGHYVLIYCNSKLLHAKSMDWWDAKPGQSLRQDRW
jgi:hypothetical protein